MILFHENDPSDHVLLIEQGRVKISCNTPEGRELLLAIRGPGDLVGELAALDHQPRSATVAALERVEGQMIGAARFTQFLEEHPRVAVALLALISRDLRDSDRKRVEFGAFDVAERIVRRLVELAEQYGAPAETGLSIDLPLTQEELAGWAGASLRQTADVLRLLRRAGAIDTHRRHVTILDMRALRGPIG
jgi:CRP-like cAMP-binding protein